MKQLERTKQLVGNGAGRGGKVDFSNLWQKQQRIRWRTLRLRLQSAPVPSPLQSHVSISTDIRDAVGYMPDGLLVVHLFGYACHDGGPWFGYTRGMLKDAPCSHCGQTDIFHLSPWNHICPGRYDGKRLPCQDDHPCRGEPSMATAPMWRSNDWIELPLGSGG